MERNRTPLHGNYHGYYSKRPAAASDPRLALFARPFFAGKRVLDVGCNEGLVTLELAQHWNVAEVLGVDVDPELVRRARERRRVLWSLEEPGLHTAAMGPSGAAGSSRVVELTGPDGHGMRHQEAGGRKDYFPQCMPYMFGPLPLPPAPTPALASASAPRPLQPFPYNISFKHLNYALSSLPEDAEGWDVILLLSVLKWIHLNSSDAGLVQFFHKACAALRPGGVLVLELQDWEGYRKAARSNPTLKQHYKTLELRPERFAEVLLGEVGFRRVEHLGVAGEGGFRRSIDVYYKD